MAARAGPRPRGQGRPPATPALPACGVRGPARASRGNS